MALGKYWQKLKDKADCWWGVPEKALYDTLKNNGVKNVVYHLEEHVKKVLVNKKNEKYIKTSSLLPIDDKGKIKKKNCRRNRS